MRPIRSLRALLVDVPPAHGRLIVRAMEEAGWRLRIEHADGADALVARAAAARLGRGALQRRGSAGRCRRARRSSSSGSPTRTCRSSPSRRSCTPATWRRWSAGSTARRAVVPDPAQLPRALTRALDATRLRRRVGGAHRFLLAQQAITDHVAAGLEPRRAGGARARHARRDARLQLRRGLALVGRRQPAALRGDLASGQRVGRHHRAGRAVAQHGARRRPGPARARVGVPPPVVGHVRAGRPERAARRDGAPRRADDRGRVPDRDRRPLRRRRRVLLDRRHEPNPEVSAMFATVGGQLAQYLERRSPRRWLDAAEAPLLALDPTAACCSPTRTRARSSGAARTS